MHSRHDAIKKFAPHASLAEHNGGVLTVADQFRTSRLDDFNAALQMSPINLYTTKALGREWIPSPVRSNSQIGRFGPYSPSSPKMKWSNENSSSPSNGSYFPQSHWRKSWTRIHERILLAIGIVMTLGLFAIWRKNYTGLSAGVNMRGYLHWTNEQHVDWSSFAYGTYATNTEYLCNSLMLLATLHKLHVKPKLLLMYDETWDSSPSTIQYATERKLLKKAKNDYGAILQPIQLQKISSEDPRAASFTKLLAFNQTSFSRILLLDSDSTVLQSMDELFLLPPTPIAMPRAYWLDQQSQQHLSSALALISPSIQNFESVHKAVLARAESDFDQEVLNTLYGTSCLILPHNPYLLLSTCLHPHLHYSFSPSLGQVAGDVGTTMESIKFVKFSSPKPWTPVPQATDGGKEIIGCTRYRTGQGYGEYEDDCQGREVWHALYEDFRVRRRGVCGAEFESWKVVEEEGEVEIGPEPAKDVEVLLADPVPEVDYRSLRYQVVQ